MQAGAVLTQQKKYDEAIKAYTDAPRPSSTTPGPRRREECLIQPFHGRGP